MNSTFTSTNARDKPIHVIQKSYPSSNPKKIEKDELHYHVSSHMFDPNKCSPPESFYIKSFFRLSNY